MRDQELLDAAVQAFEAETGQRLRAKDKAKGKGKAGSSTGDATLRLRGSNAKFHALLRPWAHQKDFGALAHQLLKLDRPMLVSDWVSPDLADHLKADDIAYIDCAGNAYIKAGDTYVWVSGRPRPRHIQEESHPDYARDEHWVRDDPASKSMSPAGLRLVYQLLAQPELVNASYRKLAAASGIALGNIGGVLSELLDADFLVIKGKGKTPRREFGNFAGLLQQFSETWPVKLRHKLLLGSFSSKNANWHETFDPGEFGAQWGGEKAAQLLIGRPVPQSLMLYLHRPEQLPKLLAKAKLKPVDTGADNASVEIYQSFWRDEGQICAHPVLIYADLVASGRAEDFNAADEIAKGLGGK